jgi:hypothetical protein
MYLWTNDLANQGKKTMEKKNVSFTKDGMKVGVKQMSEEEYADRTQRYGCLFCSGPLIHSTCDASAGHCNNYGINADIECERIACWSIHGTRVLSRHTSPSYGTRKSKQRTRRLRQEEHEIETERKIPP